MKIIKIPPTDDMKVEVVEHWDKGKLINIKGRRNYEEREEIKVHLRYG